MPAFLVPIIQAFGSLIASNFLVVYASQIASGIMLAGGLAFSSSQAKKARRKAREAYNAQQVDRLTNVTSSVAPMELVLGRVRKGGAVFFKGSAGSNNTTFLIAIALAGHEVDAVEGLYLNDQLVTLDGSGNVTSAPYALTQTGSDTFACTVGANTLPHTPVAGTAATGFSYTGSGLVMDQNIEYVYGSLAGNVVTMPQNCTFQYQYLDTTSKCNVRFVLGTSTQTADARMIELFPTLWTSAHRARGVAYAIVECTYDETAFPSGVPNVTVVLRGAKVYDPRDNLLTYAESFDNAAWSKNSTVTGNVVTAPDGTLSADKSAELGSTGIFDVYQPFSCTAGQAYTFSLHLKSAERSLVLVTVATASFVDGAYAYFNLASGTVSVVTSTGTSIGLGATITAVPGGWYRCSISLVAGTTAQRYPGFVVRTSESLAAQAGTAGNGVYAWGAQLVTGGLPKPYSRTTSAALSPTTAWTTNPALHMRYVYQHPQFGKASYYDSGRNMLRHSEEFSYSPWWVPAATTVTADVSGVPSPTGTRNADLLVETAVTNVHYTQASFPAITAGELYTFTIYAKVGGRAFLQLILDNGASVGAYATFNLTLGTVTQAVQIGAATGIATAISPASNGWFRLQITSTAGAVATAMRCAMSICTSGTGGFAPSYAGDGTSGVYVWGAQLIPGTDPGPYTRTLGTAAVPFYGTVRPEEDARFIAAANACDTLQDYIVSGVTTTQGIFKSSLVVPFGAPAGEVFDDLAQAMGGSWAFAGGQMYLKAGVYTPSVMSLTDADLAVVSHDGASTTQHPIAISVHRERAQKFNVANVTIWSKNQDYKQVQLTPLVGAALVTRDGSELVQEMNFPAVFSEPQALHIAGIMMREARDPLTVQIPLKMRSYPLELFDTVDITLPRYGWVSKTMQILGREWSAEGNLSYTLKETTAANYTADAAFSPQGYAANTALRNPWEVPVIGALTVTSGDSELQRKADGTIVSRMRVTWPALTDLAVTMAGFVEVQYRSVISAGEWTSITVNGSESQIVIPDVQDTNIYNIRARSRNSLAVGVWNTQVTHTVVGKTAPPAAFDFFTVLVQPDGTRQYNFGYNTAASQPVDWLGGEIRYVSGTTGSPDWATMAKLQDLTSYYTHSPVELNAPLSGVFTFACKSLDTSGNTSAYKVVNITLPDRRLGNVFEEFFEKAGGWTGTKSGFQIQGEILQSIDTTTWATAPATWAAWTRWNMAPTSPATYVTANQDLGQVVAGQINPTIDADGTVVVELATSPDGTTWSGYSTAAAPFNARWVRLRVTVTASGPAPVPVIRQFDWQVNSPLKTEYINDLVISGLTGANRIGVGDIRIPLAGVYTVLKKTDVVIQDSTAGAWVATRIDQTLTVGPRWQFRLNGTLTDPAFVDFYIEGY